MCHSISSVSSARSGSVSPPAYITFCAPCSCDSTLCACALSTRRIVARAVAAPASGRTDKVRLMSLRESETDATPDQVAAALAVGLGRIYRRLRQVKADSSSLTLPESSALARLDRGGPATAAGPARRGPSSPPAVG